MKRLVFLFVTLTVVLIFTSSRTTIASDSRIGTKGANFTVENEDGVVTLNQFRGKYVLLNVWSSADAMARIENIKFNKLSEQNDKLVQLALNFDRSKALFNEVVAADSIDVSSQYFCQIQDRPSFEQKWAAGEKSCTFLINGKGVIVAINPSEKEILEAIK